MIKKRIIPFVFATTLIGLTGCATNDHDNGTDTNRNNIGENVRYDTNNGIDVRNGRNNTFYGLDGRNVRTNTTDGVQNLRVSKRAGRSVENLKQVDLAHVIIRNNDAYVAVKLANNTQDGLMTRNRTRTNDVHNPGEGNSINGNNIGSTRSTSTGTITGITGVRDTGLNRNTVTNDADFKKATTGLDKKIANQVRAAEKNIDHVYVSYDTTFFKQMTNYSNDIRANRDMDGIWNDFTNTTRNIFR